MDKAALINDLSKADAAVTLEGNLCWPEFALIAKHITSPAEKILWSHGEEGYKSGALFSVDNNYEETGAALAKQIAKIITTKEDPSNIPTISL